MKNELRNEIRGKIVFYIISNNVSPDTCTSTRSKTVRSSRIKTGKKITPKNRRNKILKKIPIKTLYNSSRKYLAVHPSIINTNEVHGGYFIFLSYSRDFTYYIIGKKAPIAIYV